MGHVVLFAFARYGSLSGFEVAHKIPVSAQQQEPQIMRKTFHAILMLIAASLFTGCATKVMDYRPKASMSLETALKTIPKFVMTQHEAWRPVHIGITEDFIYQSSGIFTRTVHPVSFTHSSRAVSREINDRVYFSDIVEIQLLDWSRKGRQWYVVSILKKYNERIHIYRSRQKEEATQLIDALHVTMQAYRSGRLQDFIDTQALE